MATGQFPTIDSSYISIYFQKISHPNNTFLFYFLWVPFARSVPFIIYRTPKTTRCSDFRACLITNCMENRKKLVTVGYSTSKYIDSLVFLTKVECSESFL